MLDISKIRQKSVLGPVKAQKFLRCLPTDFDPECPPGVSDNFLSPHGESRWGRGGGSGQNARFNFNPIMASRTDVEHMLSLTRV